MKRWIIFIVILAVALIGTAGYLGFRSSQPKAAATPEAPSTTPVTVCTVSQTVDAPGSLVNTHETKIVMPENGRLAEVLVSPGETVKAGQVLARLDDRPAFAAALAAAQLALLQVQQQRANLDQTAPVQSAQGQVAIQTAQTNLKKAQEYRSSLNYPRATSAAIDSLRAQLALAMNDVANAQLIYDQVANLDSSDSRKASAVLGLANAKQNEQNIQVTLAWSLGRPTQADIAAADAQLALAQANLTQAEADWSKIKNGPAALDIALADAKVADAQATLVTAQTALANMEIKAPFDGAILEVFAAQGKTLASGADLFTLNNPQAVAVKSTVTEEDFPYVDVGQPVSLFFDALPEETITGSIIRIVPMSTGGSGSPLYEVYLSVDHVPAKLVAGMSADASINIAQRKNVLCLPRAVVQASANGSAVMEVWDGVQTAKRTVQVGLRGDTSVEILSGLKENDLVVTQ
jgi:HlyD family secretion protein